jgi:hypothetical protein
MREGTTEARLRHSVFAMLCQDQSFAWIPVEPFGNDGLLEGLEIAFIT